MNILGAGITGLILGYLTKSPVYGDVVGGQLQGLPKGPRILQFDQNTLKLVGDLGIDEAPETFYLGYQTEEEGPIRTSLLEEEKQSYYYKTRGSLDPSASSMSEGKTQILGWDLNKIPLVERLVARVEVIQAKVEYISFSLNEVGVTLSDSNKTLILPLTSCISTISLRRTLCLISENPVEIFYLQRMLDGSVKKSAVGISQLDLTCFDTTFIRVDMSQDDVPPFGKEFNYIYYTDESNPLNRATRISANTYVFECRGDRFEAAIDYLEGRGWEIGIVETIRFCQLSNNYHLIAIGLDRPEYFDNQLRLCGRFAQWEHSFKINSIFQEAEAYV